MPNASLGKIIGGIFLVLSPIAILATVFSLTGKSPVPPAQRNICTSSDSNYYSLISSVNTSNVLDVKNGYLPNGAGVQLWNWVGGANQIWFFDPIGTFSVPSTPKCKTDNGKGNDYGLGKSCWQIGTNCNSNGQLVMIRSLLNGKCLDSNNGTIPHMWDCQGWNSNQYWYFLTIDSGKVDDDIPPGGNFLIAQGTTGKCLNPLGVGNGSPQFLVNCTGIVTPWYVSDKT